MDLPHRDIYSGMVAEELAKNGAFGHEEDRYGFCSWSAEDGYRILTFGSEDECAREQFRRWALWGIVSERAFRRARLYDGETGEHLEKALMSHLETEMLPLLKADVAAHLSATSAAAESAIAQYLSAHPRERGTIQTRHGVPGVAPGPCRRWFSRRSCTQDG